MSEFTCAKCGGTFDVDESFTEADRTAEHEEAFPGVPVEDCDVVCDDCYRALMAEARSDGVHEATCRVCGATALVNGDKRCLACYMTEPNPDAA